MKNIWFISGSTLIILLACYSNTKPGVEESLDPEKFYIKASENCKDNNLNEAIANLRLAMENGLEKPMRVVRDRNLYKLVDLSEYRASIRTLLKEFAIEHQATMVRPEEEGNPITVVGKIMGESDQLPLKNVSIELVHTDQSGFYFTEKTMWNPRIFAYLKSDENGEFRIHTIHPGKYKDDDGNDVPSHIHFNLEKEGYRPYGSEFTFEDDPIFKANGYIDNIPVALKMAENDENTYQVIIYLQQAQ